MKQFIVIAFAGIVLASCNGSTSSDQYTVDSTVNVDSMRMDSGAAQDTVYPKTDTSSYIKDKDTPKKPSDK